jgi:hypothetical protein
MGGDDVFCEDLHYLVIVFVIYNHPNDGRGFCRKQSAGIISHCYQSMRSGRKIPSGRGRGAVAALDLS